MSMNIVTREGKSYEDMWEPGCFAGAILAAGTVENSVIAFHAPSGCSIWGTHYRADPITTGIYTPILSTAIHEQEVIHGGTKKLGETVRDVIKRNKWLDPKVCWIFTADATSMVGDDIDAVAREVEGETGVNVIALDTPAFSGGYNLGANLVYAALIDRFADKDVKKDNSINIIGPVLSGSRNWSQDFLEIRDLLEAADVKINTVLTYRTNVEDLKDFAKAKANYYLTSESLPNVEQISDKLGMETFGKDLILPFGITNTEEWYLKIAEKFGDVEKAKKRLREDMHFLKTKLNQDYNATWHFHDMFGKRGALLGRAPFVSSLARCLFYDYNARPVVLGILAETQQAIDSAKASLDEMSENLDFDVLINPSYFEFGLAMEKAKVHFSVGQSVDRWLSEGMDISNTPLGGLYFQSHFNFVPWPYAGVRGMLNLMTEFSYLMDRVKIEPGYLKAQSYLRAFLDREKKEA